MQCNAMIMMYVMHINLCRIRGMECFWELKKDIILNNFSFLFDISKFTVKINYFIKNVKIELSKEWYRKLYKLD